MNRKYIKTSQVEKWQRRDKLARWLPLWFPLLLMALNLPGWFNMLFIQNAKPSELASVLGFFVLFSLIASVPVMTAYRALSKVAIKNAIRNASFRVTDHIDYYRDKLSGLPPATISLLMDLQVEPDKDIAAAMLRLTLLGALSPVGTVIKKEVPGLLKSDLFLMEALERGGLTDDDMWRWQHMAEIEAVDSGYLENVSKITVDKAANKGCLFALAQYIGMSVLLFTLIYLFGDAMTARLDAVGEVLDTIPETLSAVEQVRAITSAPVLLQFTAWGIPMVLALTYWMYYPFLAFFKVLGISRQFKPFKRTPEGEVATEKIAGMKNFLRDFTLLSEAEKTQLLLWDDFLIYAVVLEENRRIVNELLQKKGLGSWTPTYR